MIQRIQTLYLVAAALLLATVIPAYVVQAGPAIAARLGTPIEALAAVGCIGALAIVFLFKDRKRQNGSIVFAQIIAVAVLVLVAVAMVSGAAEQWGTIRSGVLVALPLLASLSLALAKRAIQKDINLVRSMDRIR